MGCKLPQGLAVMLFMRRGQDCLALRVLLAEMSLPVVASPPGDKFVRIRAPLFLRAAFLNPLT